MRQREGVAVMSEKLTKDILRKQMLDLLALVKDKSAEEYMKPEFIAFLRELRKLHDTKDEVKP